MKKKNYLSSIMLIFLTLSISVHAAKQPKPRSGAINLIDSSKLTSASQSWNKTNLRNILNGNVKKEAVANSDGRDPTALVTINFTIERANHITFALKEDNTINNQIESWVIHYHDGKRWSNLTPWQQSPQKGWTQNNLPINKEVTSFRVVLRAPEGKKVGLRDFRVYGKPVENDGGHTGPGPKPIVDNTFYQAPKRFGGSYNLVEDFGVNNNDTLDDTVLLQQAIDEIHDHPLGGKLFIPEGKYYLLSVQMRSNVHIQIAQNATIYPTWNGDGRNHRVFEVGTLNNDKVENFSLVGRGTGFTVDFRKSADKKLAVFNLGDVQNFKISNINIKDNKTIFASFLVGVTRKKDQLYWPIDGIIERITQRDALFGYGIIQTYGAENILFRDLDGEGGITLRMEPDNLVMKELKQGGIKNIFAENISCTNGLAAVMFGPHFMDNGTVQVNGVVSNGCGAAVRVDKGFVELFSPVGEKHTRNSWQSKVDNILGAGCAATPYVRGNNDTRWASRINDVNNCLEEVYRLYGLKPGVFEESTVYNVTAKYGINAHLKQDQLDYFEKTNPDCNNVCLPTREQWSKQGQIYLGPSLAGVINKNVDGRKFNFKINIKGLKMQGFPASKINIIDDLTSSEPVCKYYGVPSCSDNRWD